MFIYLLNIFLIAFLGLGIHPKKNKQRRKTFLIISFLLLTIVSGFRAYSVGADTRQYVALFKSIDSIDFSSSRFETGFLIFLKLLYAISNNPTFMLLISSSICIGATCSFIYKHSKEPTLSLLLYVLLKPYFFQMTGMRQALAVAFGLFAFSLILSAPKARSYILGSLLITLAVSFHTMAIVYFIPLVICTLFKNKIFYKLNPDNILKLSIPVAIISFILYPYIMQAVSYVVPMFSGYFTGTWSESNYFASLFHLLVQFAFMVTGVIFLRKKEEYEYYDYFASLMMFFTIIVSALAMRMEIWSRLTGAFSIFTALLWTPTFVSSIKKANNRFITKIIITICAFAYLIIIFIFRPEWDGVIPYAFVF